MLEEALLLHTLSVEELQGGESTRQHIPCIQDKPVRIKMLSGEKQ